MFSKCSFNFFEQCIYFIIINNSIFRVTALQGLGDLTSIFRDSLVIMTTQSTLHYKAHSPIHTELLYTVLLLSQTRDTQPLGPIEG